MAHLYYGLYLHYLPTVWLLSHVLCQLGGPPGRSRWLWTLMNFTSNFDALISMVLRFKLRLDVIFMQARARAVHGVNPRLFCTLTKCFRERNIRLINLHKWFVSKTQTRCRSRGSRSRCLHWPDPALARDWLHRGHVTGPRPLIGPRCCYCYCQRYLECLHEWTKIKLGWQDAEKM